MDERKLKDLIHRLLTLSNVITTAMLSLKDMDKTANADTWRRRVTEM